MSHEPNLRVPLVGEAERDAVHIAIVPLVAGCDLYPGHPFRLSHGTTDVAISAQYHEKEAVGITNPFLGPNHYRIRKGDRFYGVLWPGTVVGMKHHWKHPAFDEVTPCDNEHVAWLRKFSEKWGFVHEEMMVAATRKYQEGEEAGDDRWDDDYIVAYGRDLHGTEDFELGEEAEFWDHIKALTGVDPEVQKKHVSWSCSC